MDVTKMAEAELLVRAARREGYDAEIRDGDCYFPKVVWKINIGMIINRDRLSVDWSDQDCIVTGGGFRVTGTSLQEAVLRHVADRPVID